MPGWRPGASRSRYLAAPKIVVEEAGGRLTDLDGTDSLTSGTALATNGHLHEAAVRLLQPRE